MVRLGFLHISVLAALSAAWVLPEKRTAQPQLDQVENGPYTIVNCAANASIIQKSLQNLATYLVPAVKDADKSRQIQSPAYNTFFKDSASSSYVSTLLTNVTSAPTMYHQNHFSNGAPIISCISDLGQMTYENTTSSEKTDAFATCQKNETMASYILSGTPYIILCPSFFTAPAASPGGALGYPIAVSAAESKTGASDCMSVTTSTNRFAGDGSILTAFAPWLLLEQIVHYYLDTTTTSSVGPSVDVYDPNRCAALNAQRSVENAHNFVYYVASVYGQCTQFPTNATAPGRGFLQETPNSATDATYPAGVVSDAAIVTLGGWAPTVIGAYYLIQGLPNNTAT